MNSRIFLIFSLIVLGTTTLSAQMHLGRDKPIILDRERIKMDMSFVPTGILSDAQRPGRHSMIS